MRPKQEIERLRGEVERLRKMLRLSNEVLISSGLGAVHEIPAWANRLTTQERAMMTTLITVYPRVIDNFDLDDVLPHRDRQADRNVTGLIRRIVHDLRKKLGHDSVETVFGVGYRAGARFVRAAQTDGATVFIHSGNSG